MEGGYEEKDGAQESARSGAWAFGWASAQRGEKAGQQAERTQRRLGQKPQKDSCRAAQCAASPSRPPEELIESLIALICSRFGACAIGLGDGGIRFTNRY